MHKTGGIILYIEVFLYDASLDCWDVITCIPVKNQINPSAIILTCQNFSLKSLPIIVSNSTDIL